MKIKAMCENCRFFFHGDSECRRAAPASHNSVFEWMLYYWLIDRTQSEAEEQPNKYRWPEVSKHDWCGEFSPGNVEIFIDSIEAPQTVWGEAFADDYPVRPTPPASGGE